MAYFLYLSSVLIDVLLWNCPNILMFCHGFKTKKCTWSPKIPDLGDWGIYICVPQQTANGGSLYIVLLGNVVLVVPLLLSVHVHGLLMWTCCLVQPTNRWFCYQSGAKRLTPETVNFLFEFPALSWSPCRPVKTRATCIDCDSVPLIIFLKNCLGLSKCGSHLSLFSLVLCMSLCVYV